MDIFLLAVVIAGLALSAVMVAALVSDFRRAGTRGRAWMVLIGGVLLALGPVTAEGLLRRHLSIGKVVLVLTVIFGIAALLMYALVLIATALLRLYRRCVNCRRIAV